MLGARTLPVLPTVPNLSLADLFAGNEISEKWYEAKKKRDAAICELIRSAEQHNSKIRKMKKECI